MNFEIKTDLFKRENYLKKIRAFYYETEIIKVLTGVRRCGKSSIMNMIASELIENGVDENSILYFNLDKRPYMNITTPESLDRLIEENITENKKYYLFIDEVQNVKNFETVINAWREEGNISIFLTGSNSYLLSGELATKLTGRYIEFNIYPLSFEEYIQMKLFYGFEIKSDIEELNNYILEGGFPFTLKIPELKDKRTYVNALINEIIEKDIRKRVRISNRAVFDSVMKYIINNYGSTTSLNNIMTDLANNGMTIKRETLNKYIKALVSAKILNECDRFDVKTRKSIRGEKKYYLSDTSFYFALNTDNRINYGPALENIVYIYALTKDYNVSIGKIGKFECDFILRNSALDYAYVQVAFTILASRETEDREYKSLEQIKGDNYPRYVLTTDTLLQKRNGIKHLNIPDFIKNGGEF